MAIINDTIYRDIIKTLTSETKYIKIFDTIRSLYNWNENQANYAFSQYVNHVYLCRTNPNDLIVSLSEMGTKMWRQFIFESKSNTLFIGGGFLNYIPTYDTPRPAESEAYEKTCTLYTLHFKKLPKDIVSSESFCYFIPK
jgi:hypothetical protein